MSVDATPTPEATAAALIAAAAGAPKSQLVITQAMASMPPGGARLQAHLQELRDVGHIGILPFVSAGDPDLQTTGEILLALQEAGAVAIEVGVPFSDPIADGPVIQAASQRALAAGTTLPAILDLLASLRGQLLLPIVLFTYGNPLLRMGWEAFAERAAAAGIDAVLLTDLTPGVEPALEKALSSRGIGRIVLVAPTTPPARAAWLATQAEGFVYVIARRGVTGQGGEDAESTAVVPLLRANTNVPIYLGFGVRTAADVARLGAVADGVIVGSALVQHLHEIGAPSERAAAAGAFLRELRSV